MQISHYFTKWVVCLNVLKWLKKKKGGRRRAFTNHNYLLTMWCSNAVDLLHSLPYLHLSRTEMEEREALILRGQLEVKSIHIHMQLAVELALNERRVHTHTHTLTVLCPPTHTCKKTSANTAQNQHTHTKRGFGLSEDGGGRWKFSKMFIQTGSVCVFS